MIVNSKKNKIENIAIIHKKKKSQEKFYERKLKIKY